MKFNEVTDDFVIIDTRSPAEYEETHIPGAYNIPLFTNEERAIVGTIFKKEGNMNAIKEGINIFSKKLPEMMKEYFKHRNKKILIYCWRGGMRSKVIVNFLESIGFYAKQLDGGHKAYRKDVLNYFNNIKFKPKLIVLHGLTGSGKTEILKKIQPSIDLEGIAQHRSSLLGRIGLKPRSQKMFDALLYQKLKKLENEKFVFIEGESRKIGKVEMPLFLMKKIKNGINIKIECNIDERTQRLVKEYFTKISKKDINYILEILPKLKQKISNKVINELENSINEKKYDNFTKSMLEHYYDPLYKHSLDKLNYKLITNDKKAEKDIIQFLE
tara:strand:+ start:36 stop:1019 length:984 start_codon:yes stop_codon:yes gene_type:complete